MNNKYAYTKAIHFKSKLKDDKTINKELEEKLVMLFKIFDKEFKKISLMYDFKNFISFGYVIKELKKLNEYPEFTKTPMQIKTDFAQNELLHLALLNKTFIFNKKEINDYLFNKTCENLGWFELVE